MSLVIPIDPFLKRWDGQYCEFNHDVYKYQCMDLMWQYMQDVLAVDPKPYRGWGTAKNCWNNYYNIPGAQKTFERIVNTPTTIPKAGDIIFWGWRIFVTGPAGHVAFNVGDGASLWNFISFDQNWPTKTPCHRQLHDYRGVLGWWRKK